MFDPAQEVDDEGLPLPFCLVGLHSCGDLTPNAVRLFQSMQQIKSMVLVACCYHRMNLAPTPSHCPGGEQSGTISPPFLPRENKMNEIGIDLTAKIRQI